MRRIVVDWSELTILDEEGRFTLGELAVGSGLPESDLRAPQAARNLICAGSMRTATAAPGAKSGWPP